MGAAQGGRRAFGCLLVLHAASKPESPSFLRELGLFTPCASTERLTGVHVKSCRCYRCAVSD